MMDREKIVVVIIGFLVAGFGTMYLVTRQSEIDREKCLKQCAAEGKGHISAPAGTMGKNNAQGGDGAQCICVELEPAK